MTAQFDTMVEWPTSYNCLSLLSLVPVGDTEDELRLVDDGFAKICNMVNDISVKVRTEAAVLLVYMIIMR